MPPSLALLCPPSLEISAVSSSIPGSLPVISSLPPPPCHFGVALLTYTDAGAFCSLGSWWSAVFPPLLRPAPPWGGSSPYGPCRGSVRVVSSRSFSPFSATSFPSSSGRPFRASSAACGRSRRSSVLPLAPSSCPPSVGAGSSPSTFRLAWRRLRSCGDTRKGGPRNPGPAALTCAAPCCSPLASSLCLSASGPEASQQHRTGCSWLLRLSFWSHSFEWSGGVPIPRSLSTCSAIALSVQRLPSGPLWALSCSELPPIYRSGCRRSRAAHLSTPALRSARCRSVGRSSRLSPASSWFASDISVSWSVGPLPCLQAP